MTPGERAGGTASPLPRDFYDRPPDVVAPDLLGRHLVRHTPAGPLTLRIVETEAYLGAPDRASHAWSGRRTRRNESLYLPGGHAYVYLIYGLHHCLNAVTAPAGEGGAVLVRAGEPVRGETAMWSNRARPGRPRPGDIAGGPGKLCQALGIDRRLDGTSLYGPELRIVAGMPVEPASIASGPRIGVDYAGDAAAWRLRFAIRDNPHVSRPHPWSRRLPAP